MKEKSVLDRYPDFEVNIGIEVHVQLSTKTKLFCTNENSFVHQPNSNICQICTAQPGILPVINKQAINFAIKAGLATHCTIANLSKFDRKHYFYADLPKGYQITQQKEPICTEGYITIRREDETLKQIPIIRIHMEEDAGKNIHSQNSNESFIDLNRAGTPLIEIVSAPTISSSYEAREYLKQLRLIMLYTNISTGNMEEGAFRADTNISVRRKGETKLGTRCELKNINSFKFIGDATDYEIERQIKLVKSGQEVRQETRLWDTKEKKTYVMRSKEEAADYRYFNDPDLPYIELSDEEILTIKAQLPELPEQRFERFKTEKNLTDYEAEILVNDLELGNFFDKVSSLTKSKQVINWILRNLLGYINDQRITLAESKISPESLAKLIEMQENNVINNRIAQEVFKIMAQTGENPEKIVKEKGLEQMGDSGELEKIIKEIVENNPKEVAEYKSGREKVFGFFVGQAMQKTKGKGDPTAINVLLKKYLA